MDTKITLTDKDIKAILAATNGLVIGFNHGRYITLSRMKQGRCNICNMDHINVDGYVVKRGMRHKNTYGLYIGCFHSNRLYGQYKLLFITECNIDEGEEVIEEIWNDIDNDRSDIGDNNIADYILNEDIISYDSELTSDSEEI